MGWNSRIVPYRVVRRLSMRNKQMVYETFDYKEALLYLKRAERHDGDNAHYSIVGAYRAKELRKLLQPMPDLPSNGLGQNHA